MLGYESAGDPLEHGDRDAIAHLLVALRVGLLVGGAVRAGGDLGPVVGVPL
jgi:hypothetical protein